MEGFNEAMQQEGEPSSHEKAKRKLKTPAQLEALENFYNEHKYPTEAMKVEFGKEIGLSEKQVSGWFCHRRLKDKKALQGEICTNGKQNLSSSLVHDRASGVKQESCSSTKQVDKNLDSKEVESKMYYGSKSSFGVLAYEAQNEHAHAGHNPVTEDSSSGCSSASQASYLQNNENLCVAQPSKIRNDSSMFVNKITGTKSKEYTANSRCSFLQDGNDTPAISALKWKLGRHYREDGPPLGVEFDPLPPGSFDSPVRDSKREPYYVGDSMQHKPSSFCRSVNESRLHDKYNVVKLSNKGYEDQRSFKRTNPGFIDHIETTSSHSSQKNFTSYHNHVRYPSISIDETETSMNQTSCLNDRNNPRCFRTAREYDSNAGYNSHRNSVSYPNYDIQDFQEEYIDTKAAQKKYDYNSEYLNQPQNLLKDKVRKENTKVKHCVLQPQMLINNKNKEQQFAGRCFEKPAQHQVPFMRHSFDVEWNHQQDMSGDTSSSLE